ncbi:MAG: Os1348 family NHLP clan protein [Halobacteriales archaeon]
MSVAATRSVLDRTMTDEAFLDRVRTDPDAALAEYDLTEEERAALAAGDGAWLGDYLEEMALKTAVIVVIV